MTTSLGHVAIIGGCGFLGANLVELLLKQYPDTDIAALDIRTTGNRIDSPRVSYHAVDITDLLAVEELFLKLRFDVVIHTAAMIPTKNTPNAVIHRVNVVGTQNLLTAARNADVKAFVYTSSSSVVVGDVWTVVNADERWPVLLGRDQPEYYSETKALGEIATLEANRSAPNFLTCALRPAGIVGQRDTTSMPRMLGVKGLSMRFQVGSNDNLFDVTPVENVAHAHILAAKALLQTQALGTVPLDTERVDGEAFFISNGTPIYFWDWPRKVWQTRGSKEDKAYKLGKVFVLPVGLMMIVATILELIVGLFGKVPTFSRIAVRSSNMTRYFNIEKARKRLGYEPLVGVEEGLERGAKECMARLAKAKAN